MKRIMRPTQRELFLAAIILGHIHFIRVRRKARPRHPTAIRVPSVEW